ncbi:hypothetical protein EVAR_32199_1 [Eumeta japonica]|uniref:Uncharacterized protein n=1 Tax=Eumeta variegata TaxID=151549 RepID=A0A4C1VXW5_EUMVA|nr:hypothetical protein EVAR_32199_1 [Eumeta japonica]
MQKRSIILIVSELISNLPSDIEQSDSRKFYYHRRESGRYLDIEDCSSRVPIYRLEWYGLDYGVALQTAMCEFPSQGYDDLTSIEETIGCKGHKPVLPRFLTPGDVKRTGKTTFSGSRGTRALSTDLLTTVVCFNLCGHTYFTLSYARGSVRMEMIEFFSFFSHQAYPLLIIIHACVPISFSVFVTLLFPILILYVPESVPDLDSNAGIVLNSSTANTRKRSTGHTTLETNCSSALNFILVLIPLLIPIPLVLPQNYIMSSKNITYCSALANKDEFSTSIVLEIPKLADCHSGLDAPGRVTRPRPFLGLP